MLARATDEVRRVAGDAREPTLEHLAKLEFVEACAHEAMRLKPVAPILVVQADRDTIIGDIEVRKGTVVINLLRRDSVSEQHVPRAAEFLPERWLGEGGPSQQASAAKRIAMPFGAGPRICPGRYLALLEIKLAMAALLGRFDITSVGTDDGRPAAEQLQFTMMPVGLRMTLRERG
jgi:cytochrome P450